MFRFLCDVFHFVYYTYFRMRGGWPDFLRGGETRPKILSGRKFTPLWPNSKMQELKIDSQSELLIHKPTHGRVSHANDGVIQFT